MSRRCSLAATLALTALVLTLPAPAPADASLKAIWGANALVDGRSSFPIYDALGVDIVQYQLLWSRTAPVRPANPRDPDDPAYQWPAGLGDGYTASLGHRFRIAIMVRGTPGWANGGQDENWAPTNTQDFADFLVAAARHYSRVKHWMIWGEPSRGPLFLPFDANSPLAARNYARLLDKSYGALKRVRKKNIVIGGMSWSGGLIYPVRWLRWMKLPNGKPPRLDWFGHNPFAGRYPRLKDKPYYPGVRDMSDVDTFIREVRKTYRPRHVRPKLWLSEFTVSSDRPNKGFSFFVSRAAQARWLAAAFRIAHRNRYVAGIGWWKLQDDAEPDGTTSGLFDRAGAPKPSYYAYKRAR